MMLMSLLVVTWIGLGMGTLYGLLYHCHSEAAPAYLTIALFVYFAVPLLLVGWLG